MKNQEFLGKIHNCRLALKAKPGLVSRNDPSFWRFLSLALALYGINMRVRDWGLAQINISAFSHRNNINYFLVCSQSQSLIY